jgi:hypothetical protein
LAGIVAKEQELAEMLVVLKQKSIVSDQLSAEIRR